MKKLFTAVILLLVLVLSGCGEGEKTYEAGKEAYLSGNYDQAIALYKRAVSQGYADPVIAADLALAYEKAGEPELAENSIGELEAKEQTDPRILKRLGILYMERGQDEKALSFFEQAIETDIHEMSETDLETVGFAAALEMKHTCYDEALRLYEILITQKYHPLEHEIQAGTCYLFMHQNLAAGAYFERALSRPEAKDRHALAIYKRCVENGAMVEAELYFEKGLEIRKHQADGMSEGAYYAYAGKTPADGAFDRETDREALLLSAQELLRKGKDREAEEIYLKLIKAGNASAEVYHAYMLLETGRGNYDSALRLLTQTLSYHDDSIARPAYWNEIIIYERIHDFKTAYAKLSAFGTAFGKNDRVKNELRFLKRALED